MLRLGTVVLQVDDLGRGTAFWSAALGFEQRSEGEPVLLATGGQGTGITIDETDRMHLDLHVDSAAEQAAEVDRLVGLGAVRVDWTYPPDADFVVLADPAGNLFCVVDVRHG